MLLCAQLDIVGGGKQGSAAVQLGIEVILASQESGDPVRCVIRATAGNLAAHDQDAFAYQRVVGVHAEREPASDLDVEVDQEDVEPERGATRMVRPAHTRRVCCHAGVVPDGDRCPEKPDIDRIELQSSREIAEAARR